MSETSAPLPETIVGQIDGPVRPDLPFALRLPLNPALQSQTLSGRYFLVRCAAAAGIDREGDWSLFLRRPLFVCGRQTVDRAERWQLILPGHPEWGGPDTLAGKLDTGAYRDPGVEWLRERVPGDLLNVSGPFGNGFSLPAVAHNLLLIVDMRKGSEWFWKLLPLCELTLDRGGRVTILFRARNEGSAAELVPWLPLQAEVRVAVGQSQWLDSLRDTLLWADRVCAGVHLASYGELLDMVRDSRIQVESRFAQVLVEADLLCGFGACLVCTVATAGGGHTRACVHGPVFDLTELVS